MTNYDLPDLPARWLRWVGVGSFFSSALTAVVALVLWIFGFDIAEVVLASALVLFAISFQTLRSAGFDLLLRYLQARKHPDSRVQ